MLITFERQKSEVNQIFLEKKSLFFFLQIFQYPAQLMPDEKFIISSHHLFAPPFKTPLKE